MAVRAVRRGGVKVGTHTCELVARGVVRAELPLTGRAKLEGWFAGRGWTPWEFQRQAWDAFAAGRSGLIQVATGTGKTYAAYGGPLAELIDEVGTASEALPAKGRGGRRNAVSGLRVLFVTPLRAVSRDIELALKAPVEDMGLSISIESRTGDTKASVRVRQREMLPNVLITTPESLSLLLTRETAAEQLGGLRAVIVDEWHELLASKRGTQMELALSRLRGFAPGVRAWALSATVANLGEAASAVVGVGVEPVIVQAEMSRPVVVDTVLPSDLGRLPWAGHMGLVMLPDVVRALDPAVSTLLFTNTRSQAERWYHAILVERPEWAGVMALHHGSIDRAERERVEGGVKSGTLRIVVATSSLDLGVDFAPVERVFQIGSPKGIARIAQRAGRASHRPFASCRITCVPTHALELIEVAAAREALDKGEIEARAPLSKPLDVLAQHLVTSGLGGGFVADELFEEVRRAYSYRGLTREEFDWALALVTNGGGTLAAYPEYHRVALVEGKMRVPSKRLGQLHRLNVGTITGSATVEIRYVRGRSLGHIEEGFIEGLREGQGFVFAGKTLRFVVFRDLTAYVRPSPSRTTCTPIWSGTRLPISESLAGSIRRTLERAGRGVFDSVELDAARPIVAAQKRMSRIPAADELLVECCTTREGSHLFMFPFEGRLVNGGLGSIIALRLSRLMKATFSVAVNDYGVEILCADEFPYRELLTAELFAREGLLEDTAESVNISELAKMQFREVARVSGLVFQTYPGTKRSGRQVHASSSLLFEVLSEFDPGNLLLHQARREVLERHFEQGRLGRTLDRLAEARMVVVDTERLTPLAFPLVIERLAGRLSSESILERVEKMKRQWE